MLSTQAPAELVPLDDEAEVRMLPYVVRAYRNADCRSPVVVAESDGDALPTVQRLARDHGGCSVWAITVDGPRSARNAVDYVDVGVRNGDWVYLRGIEYRDDAAIRELAVTLATLQPDPKAFPRRELFRLWLEVKEPVQVDTAQPAFPPLLMKAVLFARPGAPPGSEGGASPDKLHRKLPCDPPQWEEAMTKRQRRRDKGEVSDNESDTEEPRTGRWFDRALDFFNQDAGTVARVQESIFDYIDANDVSNVYEIANSGRVDLARVQRGGMTPLMYAVSRERTASVRVLLEAGADIEQHRAADGSPLLFMCIESEELLLLLLEAGCDYHERFEGHTVEDHPLTDPAMAALLRKTKADDAAAAAKERRRAERRSGEENPFAPDSA